jgi:hypothetical protein
MSLDTRLRGLAEPRQARRMTKRVSLPNRWLFARIASVTLILAACGSGTIHQVRSGVYETRCRDSTAECISLIKGTCGRDYTETDRVFAADGQSSSGEDRPGWYTVTFSCSPPGDEADLRTVRNSPTPRASQMRSAALERVEADYIARHCDRRVIAGISVRQCGLQVRENVWSEESLARFFSRICKLSPQEITQPIPESCIGRLMRKWHGLLAERYYMMDVAVVERRCDAHPEDCENLDAFESWCLESHNRRVLDRYQRERTEYERVATNELQAARAELERRQAAEEEESRRAARAFGDALSQIGAHLQGKPVFRCSQDGLSCWQQ